MEEIRIHAWGKQDDDRGWKEKKKRRDGGEKIKGIYRYEEESEIRIRDAIVVRKSRTVGMRRGKLDDVKRKVKVNNDGGERERVEEE